LTWIAIERLQEVKVRDLFKPGLTVPEHEVRDLHYIGEALPVPSLITSSISVEADASTGDSPVPAREDHVHAVDVESLIQFINENEELVDLTNYYTKSEIDAIIENLVIGEIGDIYYTKDEIDGFLLILSDAIDAVAADLVLLATDLDDNYYTKTEIDAIIAALYDTEFFAFEKEWSYGTVVAPTATTTLGRYDAFRAFNITEVSVTLVTASTTDYIIKLWVQTGGSGGYFVENTTTITASDLIENDVLSVPLAIAANDQILITIDAESDGDGEILVVSVRGFYTT